LFFYILIAWIKEIDGMKQLTGLEIKILLKCARDVLSKTQLTQCFRAKSLKQRYEAIQALLDDGFLTSSQRPRPSLSVVTKVPTYYEITEKGRAWLKKYCEEHPNP